jgi:hypothetical protein
MLLCRQSLSGIEESRSRSLERSWRRPGSAWRGRGPGQLGNILRAFPAHRDVGPFLRADEAVTLPKSSPTSVSDFLLPIPASRESACDKSATRIPPQRHSRSFIPGSAISNFLHPFNHHPICNLHSPPTHARLVLSR